jgi:TPR repeat protein
MFRLLGLAVGVAIFAPSVSAAEGKRYAVLVGVQKYDHSEFKSPEYSEADVSELGGFLKTAGYEVALLTDTTGNKDKSLEPTKTNIEKSLKAVLDKCKHDDLVVIAFAGHGLHSENKGGYLCPKDAKPLPEGADTLISLETLCKNLDDSTAGSRVLLVDACRESPKGARSSGIDGEGVKVPDRVFSLFSCSDGERSVEHKVLAHGVFFQQVLEGLKGKAVDGNDAITFASLAQHVRMEVPKQVTKLIKDAKQTPVEHSGEKLTSPTLAMHPEAIPPQEWAEYLSVWSNSSTKPFLDKHVAKRFAAWKKSAEAGSPRGMMLLGDCYDMGAGVAKDPKECALWYGKAANAGNSFAMVGLGMCLRSGSGVKKDEKAAVEWFRKSAELGDPGGMQLLGSCYSSGTGVDRDSEEAVKWYRKAADLGFGQAVYSLGLCYLEGVGVEEDKKEAARLFRKGADAGGHSCMTLLGLCYQNGFGVGKDEKEGVMWFRKAAAHADPLAMNMLARCYLDGTGVDEDAKEAVNWLRKAAELDNVMAMVNLGVCYIDGIGVDKDRKEAARWLRKAASRGNTQAKELLKSLTD